MIVGVRFKAGSSEGAAPLVLQTKGVTILVGPNNSGKSLALREIAALCSGNLEPPRCVVDHVDFAPMTTVEAEDFIARFESSPPLNQILQPGHVFLSNHRGHSIQVGRSQVLSLASNPASDPRLFSAWLGSLFHLSLDGPSRINLVQDQSAGDMLGPSIGTFAALVKNDERRAQFRSLVSKALGQYPAFDPTNLGSFRLRLHDAEPGVGIEHRFDPSARDYHSRGKLASELSDGVKAYLGIVTQLLAGDPDVLLIDEPEAFLHPGLAQRLGNQVSKLAENGTKSILISTHSPFFVAGCVEAGVAINVVRLTYRGGKATARSISADDLRLLMRSPLLRSTNLLAGLFYEFVVLSEADSDRAFYQEVNERLLAVGDDRGVANCLFINTHGKDQIHTLLEPLRRLGVPAAAVLDIDVLKKGGRVFTRLLAAAGVPMPSHGPLQTLRASVLSSLEKSGKDMKRDGGIKLLSGADLRTAQSFLQMLASYGIFVVEGGELESWLVDLGVTGHSPEWLTKMFEAMGEDPTHESYVRPSSADVWAFFGKLKGWLSDPARAGNDFD